MMNLGNGTDLIAFSSESFGHEALRTTKLLRDAAFERRVYFFEAPVLSTSGTTTYYIEEDASGVKIIRPYLNIESSIFERKKALLEILKDVIYDEHISHYSMWTDTPVAMPFIRNLTPEVIVYDCLSDFSKSHSELERELLQYADSVQTEGMKGPVVHDPLRNLRSVKFKETYYNV